MSDNRGLLNGSVALGLTFLLPFLSWLHIFAFTDTNSALHYYCHDNAQTANGFLNISTIQKVNEYRAFNEKTKKFYADKKYVQSAMLQGWNKFCFTGGIVEFSAQLPGKHNVGGLWPACKLLGVELMPGF